MIEYRKLITFQIESEVDLPKDHFSNILDREDTEEQVISFKKGEINTSELFKNKYIDSDILKIPSKNLTELEKDGSTTFIITEKLYITLEKI